MSALSPTLELACDLIRRPSVTPVDEGCQELMMRRLEAAGFRVRATVKTSKPRSLKINVARIPICPAPKTKARSGVQT